MPISEFAAAYHESLNALACVNKAAETEEK